MWQCRAPIALKPPLAKFCLLIQFTERSIHGDIWRGDRLSPGFLAMMIVSDWSKLEQLFPIQSEIPSEHRLPGLLRQRSILVAR